MESNRKPYVIFRKITIVKAITLLPESNISQSSIPVQLFQNTLRRAASQRQLSFLIYLYYRAKFISMHRVNKDMAFV